MDVQPRYVLLVEPHVVRGRSFELARCVHSHLQKVNEEYADKCASGRLLPVETGIVPTGTWEAMRREKTNLRGNFEEYKHPCLVNDLSFAARVSPQFAGTIAHTAKVS
jgi:hypothetical protein